MNIIRKGQGTFIKILSLAIGLTVGLVLIAKVQLERNYDCCIVDKEHVYELQETFQRKGQEPQQYGATSGGIAPVLAREIPEIQTATRYTGQFSEEKLTLENGNRHFFEEAIFADSCFFDIFATHVLQGDAHRTHWLCARRGAAPQPRTGHPQGNGCHDDGTAISLPSQHCFYRVAICYHWRGFGLVLQWTADGTVCRQAPAVVVRICRRCHLGVAHYRHCGLPANTAGGK